VGSGASENSSTGSGLTCATPGHSHGASIAITAGDSHAHTVGDTGSTSSLPRYITRAYIRRMS
jgi:hypothetical protein